MKNEIEIVESLDHQVETLDGVTWKQPVIMFTQYNDLLAKAQKVADYLSTQEVTEDNIAESKKVVAKARAMTKLLSEKRIEIKKSITEPVTEFENQIKEITAIIDEADETVRSQIRELEEQERDHKEDTLHRLFDERAEDYAVSKLRSDAWSFWIGWNPAMLNKTVSINKAEDSMVNWLEQTESEIETIKAMNNSDDVMVEYLKSFKLADAIQSAYNNLEMKKTVQKVNESDPGTKVERMIIAIEGTKNIKLAKIILKENDIDFTEVK